MSKAIVIKKNGVSQNLTVDKLRTNGADGQSIDWVPEDTVQLVALNATANGTYTPTGGAYGFEYATVSVPGSVVTGKKPDGNTYVYTKDGSGALVETKVPSEIRIITPPDYVGPYGDGAYISFEGLTVEAFYADGTSAGVIDPQDLIFPVTVARYDPDADPLVYGMSSDLLPDSVPCSVSITDTTEYDTEYIYSVLAAAGEYGNAAAWGGTDHSYFKVGMIFAASGQNSKYTDGQNNFDIGQLSAEHGGKTVYYSPHSFLSAKDAIPNLGYIPQQADEWKIAWTIIYGTLTGTSGGVQIPVQYQRPADGLVLENSFGISVVHGPSGGDD